MPKEMLPHGATSIISDGRLTMSIAQGSESEGLALAAGALIAQEESGMVSSFVGELLLCHGAEPLASRGCIPQAMLDAMRG